MIDIREVDAMEFRAYMILLTSAMFWKNRRFTYGVCLVSKPKVESAKTTMWLIQPILESIWTSGMHY